jgi:hypothetical protein
MICATRLMTNRDGRRMVGRRYGEGTMKRAILFALALGFVASSASAMPLIQRSAIVHADNVVNVKIVCEQDGNCVQRGRRPVARWVYGEGAFYGPFPYAGPGYYGRPGRHWAWWAFLGF